MDAKPHGDGYFAARTRAPQEPVPTTTVDDWALPRLPYRSVRGDIGSAFLAVAGAVFAAATGFGHSVDLNTGAVAASLALTVAAAAALLLKRRVPVLAVAAVGVVAAIEATTIGQMNLGMLLAIADVLYASTLLGSRRERRVVIATVTVIVIIAAVTNGGPLEAAIMSALLLGLPLFLGTAARQSEQIVTAERQRRRAQTERADALVEAAVAERSRAVAAERATLARDLHDGVAAQLSAIALQSGAASGDTNASMAAIRASSVDALAQLRQLIRVLDTDGAAGGLQVPGDVTDRTRLADEAARYDVPVSFALEVSADDLSRSVSHALYKIAREAIVNAGRHAPGQELHLSVHIASETVVLMATNALPAAAQQLDIPEGGLGTALMAEQAAAVGGTCHAGADGRYWVVQASVQREQT